MNAIDLLGGSYHVEELTNRIEAQAYDYFDRIEKLGGMVEAIKQNFPQREIADAAFRYQAEVSAVSALSSASTGTSSRTRHRRLLKIDAALETKQIERVKALKGRSTVVQARLGALKERPHATTINLMPVILDAARDYVTMGEMCDAWREVWGTWRETPVF